MSAMDNGTGEAGNRNQNQNQNRRRGNRWKLWKEGKTGGQAEKWTLPTETKNRVAHGRRKTACPEPQACKPTSSPVASHLPSSILPSPASPWGLPLFSRSSPPIIPGGGRQPSKPAGNVDPVTVISHYGYSIKL